MIPAIDDEQEKLWSSVESLFVISPEQAEAVLKVTIERFLSRMGLTLPAISNLTLKITDLNSVKDLHQIEKTIDHQLKNNDREVTYELLIDFLMKLSEMTDSEPTVVQKKLIASLIANIIEGSLKTSFDTCPPRDRKNENSFFSPSKAAKKIGLSDQTIRRMCEKGKFTGAYKTDGGHWRIPKSNFVTTDEQDNRAKNFFDRIDIKNQEFGNEDEFDL